MIICSICGMIDFFESQPTDGAVVQAMCDSMTHRGPDQRGFYFTDTVKFGHNRLAVMDVDNGVQPMTRTHQGNRCTIVYNGEIYNGPQLLTALQAVGLKPTTSCDTELVLLAYLAWGADCVQKLNGIFAFAIHEESTNRVFLARDRFGVKPFFYTQLADRLVFASEIKALLCHPQVKPVVDRAGLWQLLFLSPMKLTGTGIFRDIQELEPAHCAYFDDTGLHTTRYWALQATPFHGDEREAIAQTRVLLNDAIHSQLVSDVPLCTFLSGGLDSSVISAVAAEQYRLQGQTLSTYSFEYANNDTHFQKTLFQPQADDSYARAVATTLGTDHTVLTITSEALADHLHAATVARDLPGMADIDSSLLYYCRAVKKRHTVALSGECADEIFGGYPWFYRPEMLARKFYPWIHHPFARIDLFRKEVVSAAEGYDYLSTAYQKDVANFPMLEEDSPTMRNSRKATYLSTKYFMTSLLERKDRMSMASGVEVRVPFSDHRLLEYVYNLPWEIKFAGGVEKALLRNAMQNDLPQSVLTRKKSPYPKTHDPKYETLITKQLQARLADSNSPLHELLCKDTLRDRLDRADDTWYGQLMSRPQLLAWLIQLDDWLTTYQVELR